MFYFSRSTWLIKIPPRPKNKMRNFWLHNTPWSKDGGHFITYCAPELFRKGVWKWALTKKDVTERNDRHLTACECIDEKIQWWKSLKKKWSLSLVSSQESFNIWTKIIAATVEIMIQKLNTTQEFVKYFQYVKTFGMGWFYVIKILLRSFKDLSYKSY